jgi:hypothetical protein
MKKNSHKRTTYSSNRRPGEKSVDTIELDHDIPEGFRDANLDDLAEEAPDTTKNWSQPEDRGEDLINERDPFIQQPERDTEIPPELVQERAYRLYEQRGEETGDNLSDWFEAERQVRGELGRRQL